ncbi:MAG: HAMP domain-containing sensor histidine kinase [Oscillospiraceae bacterium]
MKKNKAYTIQTLVIKNLIIYVSLLIVGVWGLSSLTSALIERYFSSIEFTLNINTLDPNVVTESFLVQSDAQIVILDEDFNVIKKSGAPIIQHENLTNIQMSEMLEGIYPQQDYYVSFKPIEPLVEFEPSVEYTQEGGTTSQLAPLEERTAAPFSEYMLLLQRDEDASGVDYNVLRLYMGSNIIAIIMLVIIILLLFVRSVYRPLKANFEVIEVNISKTPYDNSLVDVSRASLKESQSVLSAYNMMIEALNYESAQKQKAVELNRQLITNLAHDLKSPITILKGYSEVLAQEGLDTDSQKEYISYIEKSSNDLSSLVNLLFEQIKYQNGNSLNFERADLNSVLREVCANYYMIFDKRGFSFISDISEESYITAIDTVNIKRVFTNLLQNILNHNAEPTKVLVSSCKKDGGFVIQIKDDGVGIPPDSREKVFDAFFQMDSSRNGQNSGIGLYVARQIVEKHGGTITLDSEKGYKTVFTITFK